LPSLQLNRLILVAAAVVVHVEPVGPVAVN
jgi:hypothetical protein